MTVPCFADTNLLVYARDASEPEKQPQASAWVERLWRDRLGRTSIQVLSEYFVTVTQKLSPGLPREAAWEDVEDLLAWEPVPADAELLRAGRRAQDRWAVSWWDALIVAAALRAGARYLLTEDLQDGQVLDTVEIVSPFRCTPTDLLGSA